MADVPVSGLTALGGAPATNDLMLVVDVSDTTQAPTGTTKKMTTANLFTSPTMTSVTVSSGGVTVTAGGLTVVAGTTAVQALTATSGTFSGITQANAGVQIGGSATLAASAVALISFETPVTRIYVGDGTGFSMRFTKRVASANTDLVTISDVGALSILGDFAINTNKFTVAAASGNTVVAGTLTVSGASTFTVTGTVPAALNRGDSAALAGYLSISRIGAVKGYLGLDASDNVTFLSANAASANLTITDAGVVTARSNINTTGVYQVSGTQVVSARSTGWAAQSGAGSASKSDIGTIGTWTATNVGVLLLAHHAALVAHGLIGT